MTMIMKLSTVIIIFLLFETIKPPSPVVIVLAKSRLKIPTSAWVPTKIPLHFEPNDSQASSKIGILFFFEIDKIFHITWISKHWHRYF